MKKSFGPQVLILSCTVAVLGVSAHGAAGQSLAVEAPRLSLTGSIIGLNLPAGVTLTHTSALPIQLVDSATPTIVRLVLNSGSISTGSSWTGIQGVTLAAADPAGSTGLAQPASGTASPPAAFATAAPPGSGAAAGALVVTAGAPVGGITLATDASDGRRLVLVPASLASLLGGMEGTKGSALGVARALDRGVAGGADVSAWLPLYSLPAEALPRALTQLSAPLAAAAAQMGVGTAGLFLERLLDPVPRGPVAGNRDGDDAAAPRPRLSVWADAFGGGMQRSANAASSVPASTFGGGGAAFGADIRLGEHVTLGAALGGAGSRLSSSGGTGSADSSQFLAGLHGSLVQGPLRLAAALAYAGVDVTTRRELPFLGPGRLQGRFTSQGVSTRLEAGWRFALPSPRLALTPQLAFQGSWFDTPSYTEWATGALAPAALAVAGRTQGTSRVELGLRADLSLSAQFSAFGRVAWAAYLQRDARMNASFAGLPDSGFSTLGPRPDPSSALLSAGLTWKAGGAWTVAARLDSEFSGNTAAAGGTLRLHRAF